MARLGLLRTSDDTKRQPKPVSPYSRNPYEMLPRIRDRVTRDPVGEEWLRTYAETLRAYHRHPESKFLDGDYLDRGKTRRRHVLVQTIEDIGKEANKWDDEEPLSADNEFTVSYGVSETDRASMLTVIRLVSKRKLAHAAKVSTRSIPCDEMAAGELSDAELRRFFEVAAALAEGERKQGASDAALVRWLAERVEERGLKNVAGELEYDPANLLKAMSGKRGVSIRFRERLAREVCRVKGLL